MKKFFLRLAIVIVILGLLNLASVMKQDATGYATMAQKQKECIQKCTEEPQKQDFNASLQEKTGIGNSSENSARG